MMQTQVAIIGAGMSGISTAYYLVRNHGIRQVLLIEALPQVLAYTSAQSGENYRNWWPHPTMQQFSNRSIHLMEDIARASDNRIALTRRGYLLATRKNETAQQLVQQIGAQEETELRIHKDPTNIYQPPRSPSWETAPTGVDVLQDQSSIQKYFPSLDPNVHSLVHIRRAGDLSGHQLGSYLLEQVRGAGGTVLTGVTVESMEQMGDGTFSISVRGDNSRPSATTTTIQAGKLVNAAGPFAKKIAKKLGVELPIDNIFQQKIAFEDNHGAIPRNLPFTIDLDDQAISWTPDELEYLSDDPSLRWLTEGTMPGSIHCRPDGGENGSWIKLGWAYNRTKSQPEWDHSRFLDDIFPEIVLRAASRLHPSLGSYKGQLPRKRYHYGGWYSMTKENWPLIGPMGKCVPGAFLNCAPSGFGTMMACAAGELCAAWVAEESDLPNYARDLSLDRYHDEQLMTKLYKSDQGVL